MDFIKSGIIQLFGAVSSLQGGRSENQDDYCFADTPLGFLAIVCDGMGGGPGGKTASYIVKTEMTAALCECTPQTPREQAFRMAAARANQALEEKMQQVPQLVGMGSTFVAVLINQQSAIVAHAGDSRFYRLHGKKCLYRTNDHSLVGELVSRKALTEEQARVSPQSNVITRGLGSTTNHVPDIQEIPYRKGDRFVLCTDGVWGIMPHENLLNRLTAPTDITSLVQTLSAEVDQLGYSQGGQHDNHTLVIIELDADSAMKTRRLKWPLFAGATLGVALLVIISVSVTRFINDIFSQRRHDTNYSGSLTAYNPSSERNSSRNTYTPSLSTSTLKSDTQSIDGDSTKPTTSPATLKDSVSPTKTDTTTIAKSDSFKSKNSITSLPPEQRVERIINILNDAKQLKKKDPQEMAQRLKEYKEEAVDHLDSLETQSQPGSQSQKFLSKMKTALNQRDLWYYGEQPDNKGFYYTTPACSTRLSHYEKLMRDFYNNFTKNAAH